MLDLVPLAGAGREVADGDGQPGLGGEGGQSASTAGAVAVGAARVGGDQQPVGVRVAAAPTACHQRRMVATAKAAVSWSAPTVTQPASAARS